jgi:glutathione S-transferase
VIVYGDITSGNCLKVKYTADRLGIPFTWCSVDVVKCEARMPSFLAINPMGQVPVVVFDDGRTLAQSNAIIRYLARGSDLLPEDPFDAAKVDELLFWEQYSHEPYIAVCRYHMLHLGKPKEAREPWRVARGEAALDLMETMLADCQWFACGRFTIADIALLAYTRLAGEGGFDLLPRPGLRAWISRCEERLGLEPVNENAGRMEQWAR